MPKNTTPLDIYALNAKIVKHLTDNLAQLLAHLFKACIREGIFPVELKTSRIVTVIKKGSTDNNKKIFSRIRGDSNLKWDQG